MRKNGGSDQCGAPKRRLGKVVVGIGSLSLVALSIVGLAFGKAYAASDLAVGQLGGDGRVTAIVTATRSASSYSGINGNWFVADVTLDGVSGVRAQPFRFIEQVHLFSAEYDVQADGSILVTEHIEYDFGRTSRHGIYRDLALFQPIDADHERRYPITEVTVSTSDGTPAKFELLRTGDFQRIKIGDAKVLISGTHTYTISYRIGGALNPQPAGPELYFNVTGTWTVGMDHVTVIVKAPAGTTKVACFAGATGSTKPCTNATLEAGVAQYDHDSLEVGEQMTIVAAFPIGSVAVPAKIIGEAPRNMLDAIKPDLPNVGGAAAIGVFGLAGIGWLMWRKGRDLESSGSPVDAVMSPDEHVARRLPLLRGVNTPVQFAPPKGCRPGLIGTLYDERADTVDVSATIIDLAIRGYLRIEEVPKAGIFLHGDHHLVRLRPDTEGLGDYERILLNGLFSTGDDVLLSALKNTFAVTLGKVKDSLYTKTVQRKWFARRPDQTRSMWIGIASGVLTVAGVGIAISVKTKYWLWPPVALAVVGMAFLVASRWMPRRTARGTATLRLTEGFREFIVESDASRAEFAEQQHLFIEYLPYAMVFGCVDKWAKTFAGLDGRLPDTSSWYVGTNTFNALAFSHSINGFATAAGATMSSTPGGSGGSGFSGGSSGGGGGGGGGGSW